jgi:Rod binding domain-containing protein
MPMLVPALSAAPAAPAALSAAGRAAPAALPPDAALRARAEALEAAFLAEMLGHAGFGAAGGAFGGGTAEDQFASFLRHAHAEAVVRRGGIGLAEMIVRSLAGRSDAAA